MYYIDRGIQCLKISNFRFSHNGIIFKDIIFLNGIFIKFYTSIYDKIQYFITFIDIYCIVDIKFIYFLYYIKKKKEKKLCVLTIKVFNWICRYLFKI